MFGSVSLLGFFLQSHVITTHINSNHRAWARTSISGMAILSTVGGILLTMVNPEVHAWHNTAVEIVRIFFISLEACLLVYSKRNEDGDNQNSNWNLLIISDDTFIPSYRFFGSIAKTHSPWDTEKILHLVGAGLPVLIGTGHFFWILYKAHIRPKAVVGWLMKIPRVFARKTEQAAGATMGGNGGRDAVDKAADELVEVGNGLPVTTGASQVGWIAYTAGIKFKFAKWFRKTRRVSAAEDEQAAGVAMEIYGGDDSGHQVQEQDVQVVVASLA